MSLINEALKKAQRQRNEEQADLIAPMPGGGGSGAPLVKRTSARSTQSIMLLATGGIALFVVCVVVSVIWINRPAPRKPMAIKSSATKSSVPAPAPAIIVVPLPSPASGVSKTIEPIAVPVAGRAPAIAGPESAALPTMSSARSPPISDLATPSRAESPPTPARELAPSFARTADPLPTEPAVIAGKFDERIQTLVDGFRVAGIRASGTGSKVLLNEKVFKINDIVDRTNSLRLTQVTNDSLTFTTPGGVTYVKNF